MKKAKVRVSRGMTINLGNFESERIELSIEEECTVDEIESIYEKLLDSTECKLIDEVEKIKK